MTTTRDLVVDLLAETRDEINRADSKANLLLTGAGLAVAAIVAGVISGELNPIDARGVVQTLSVLSATALGVGLVAVGAAVFPRLGSPVAGCARYFMEIAALDDIDSLESALNIGTSEPHIRRMQQLLVLSKAVRRKYRLIRASEVLLGIGVGLAAAAGITHVALA